MRIRHWALSCGIAVCGIALASFEPRHPATKFPPLDASTLNCGVGSCCSYEAVAHTYCQASSVGTECSERKKDSCSGLHQEGCPGEAGYMQDAQTQSILRTKTTSEKKDCADYTSSQCEWMEGRGCDASDGQQLPCGTYRESKAC